MGGGDDLMRPGVERETEKKFNSLLNKGHLPATKAAKIEQVTIELLVSNRKQRPERLIKAQNREQWYN